METWGTIIGGPSDTHPIKGGRWVKTIAAIRNNATGEVRQYKNDAPLYEAGGETEPSAWIWSNGNFSCDCNRALFFGYAIGQDMDGDQTGCGDGGYLVNLINPVNGRVFYREFEDASGEPSGNAG